MAIKSNKIFLNIFKVIISIGIIIVILIKVDYRSLPKILGSIDWRYLVLGVIGILAEILLMSYRLYVLILLKSMRVSVLDLLKLNFISIFVGIFLPTRLGMEGLRIFYLTKHTGQAIDSFWSVAMDRFLNMIVITAFAILAFILGKYYKTLPVLTTVLVPMVAGFVFLSLTLVKRVRVLIRKILLRLRAGDRLVKWLGEFANSFYEFQMRPALIFWLILLAIVFQLTRVTTSFLFAECLHFHIPYGYFFIMIPVIEVMSLLPFSVAGLGIQQGTSVYLFNLFGVKLDAAVGLNLLTYVVRIVICLPGLYYFYHEGLDSLMQSISKTKRYLGSKRAVENSKPQ